MKMKPEPLPPSPRPRTRRLMSSRTTAGPTVSATRVIDCEYASSSAVSLEDPNNLGDWKRARVRPAFRENGGGSRKNQPIVLGVQGRDS